MAKRGRTQGANAPAQAPVELLLRGPQGTMVPLAKILRDGEGLKIIPESNNLLLGVREGHRLSIASTEPVQVIDTTAKPSHRTKPAPKEPIWVTDNVPKGYWNRKQNRRRAIEWLAEKVGYPKNKVVGKHFRDNGLAGLLNRYNGSPKAAFTDVGLI